MKQPKVYTHTVIIIMYTCTVYYTHIFRCEIHATFNSSWSRYDQFISVRWLLQWRQVSFWIYIKLTIHDYMYINNVCNMYMYIYIILYMYITVFIVCMLSSRDSEGKCIHACYHIVHVHTHNSSIGTCTLYIAWLYLYKGRHH